MECKYRLAIPDDAPTIVAFHNTYYGGRRTPEDWLWEYQTYAPSKSVFALAEDGGRLVATQAMIPVYMDVGCGTVLSGKSENTLLLPQYRGSALMAELYEYAVRNCTDRGMEFVWGFTDAVTAFKRFGFVHFPSIQMMVRPGRISLDAAYPLGLKGPLWRRSGASVRLILKWASAPRAWCLPSTEDNHSREVRRGQRCDETQLRNLLERLKRVHNQDAISIMYDSQFLQWRIRGHPLIRYDEYQVYEGRLLRACGFVGLRDDVVSISFLASEDACSTSLLIRTILRDYAQRVRRFQFLGNVRDPLAEGVIAQLRRFGFVPIRTWNLVLRDLSQGRLAQLSDMRNWHVNGLWTEGYSM